MNDRTFKQTLLSKHETLAQRWFTVGQPSMTLAQHWTNVGLLLAHRLWRWSNSKPTLGQCLIFAGYDPPWSSRVVTAWQLFLITANLRSSTGTTCLSASPPPSPPPPCKSAPALVCLWASRLQEGMLVFWTSFRGGPLGLGGCAGLSGLLIDQPFDFDDDLGLPNPPWKKQHQSISERSTAKVCGTEQTTQRSNSFFLLHTIKGSR